MHTLQLYILRGRLDYLSSNPDVLRKLVNRAIYVGEKGEHKKHPLEFICDCIGAEKITPQLGLGLFSLLIENGANVNGFAEWKEDTPLLTAIGYYLEDIAHFLLDKGADYTHLGHHGATALHWAAWTGQASLLHALLQFPVDIDVGDHDFGATPLLYGIHGYFRGGEQNRNQQIECIKSLLEAGADPRHKDREGNNAWAYIDGRDGEEILELLPDRT